MRLEIIIRFMEYWTYFTADDGQVDLNRADYLGIGTLESFIKMCKYYGSDAVCPIYIQVEDGERLSRALKREREQENPKCSRCAGDFWRISLIFQKRMWRSRNLEAVCE